MPALMLVRLDLFIVLRTPRSTQPACMEDVGVELINNSLRYSMLRLPRGLDMNV